MQNTQTKKIDKKVIVLNPVQYKDKRYREHFESGGFEVVEDKPMNTQTTQMKQQCTNCGNVIKKIGVMILTTNPKMRNMCMDCAKRLIKKT